MRPSNPITIEASNRMDSVSNIAGERDLQVATLLNYLTGPPHAALPNERGRLSAVSARYRSRNRRRTRTCGQTQSAGDNFSSPQQFRMHAQARVRRQTDSDRLRDRGGRKPQISRFPPEGRRVVLCHNNQRRRRRRSPSPPSTCAQL